MVVVLVVGGWLQGGGLHTYIDLWREKSMKKKKERKKKDMPRI